MGKIVTASGLWIDPLALETNQVTILDIAAALSKICRYGGHTNRFYSVAEHCLIGAQTLNKQKRHVEALAFLLHDCSEAYLGIDVPDPYKGYVQIDGRSIEEVEQSIHDTVLKGLGLYGRLVLPYVESAVYSTDQLIRIPELERFTLFASGVKTDVQFDFDLFEGYTHHQMASAFVVAYQELSSLAKILRV